MVAASPTNPLGVKGVGETGAIASTPAVVRSSRRSQPSASSPTTPASVTLSEEHDDVRLMTFDEAREIARFPEYLVELDALERVL